MINSQILDRIMQRLTRTAPTTRAIVLLELNEKIRELERGPVKPWFMEKSVSGVLTSLQNTLALPSDFLEEYEEGAFRIQDLQGAWSAPIKVPIERLEHETDALDPALPEGYSLFGEVFYLGPAPASAYPYKLKYYGRTTAIVDDGATTTNQWALEFFNYLTLVVAHLVANTHLQSMEIVTKIEPELAIAHSHFWRAVESRKHANADYLVGDSEN